MKSANAIPRFRFISYRKVISNIRYLLISFWLLCYSFAANAQPSAPSITASDVDSDCYYQISLNAPASVPSNYTYELYEKVGSSAWPASPTITRSTALSNVPPFYYVRTDKNIGTYTYRARICFSGTTTCSGYSNEVAVPVNLNCAGLPVPTVSMTTPSGVVAGKTTILYAAASTTSGSISNVEFYVDGAKIGTAYQSPYGTPWAPAVKGTYQLRAVANASTGAVSLTSLISVTVAEPPPVPPVVTFTSPLNGANYSIGSLVSITASATDSDGTIASVAFYANNLLISTDTSSPYQITTWYPSADTYDIKAVATDNKGLTATATTRITVGKPTVTAQDVDDDCYFTLSMNAPTFVPANQIYELYEKLPSASVWPSTPVVTRSTGFNPPNAPPFRMVRADQASGTYQYQARICVAGFCGPMSDIVSVLVKPTCSSLVLPSVSIFNPIANQTYAVGQPITIRANATTTQGAIQSVTFNLAGQTLATDTTAPYEVSWTPTVAGDYLIQAVADGTNGGTKVSEWISFKAGTVVSSSSSSSSSRLSSSSRSSVDIPYIRPEQPVNAVGATPYTADVNHKGEGVISIPIQLAAGINDMQPQLSLVYNSGGTTAKVQNQTAGGLLSFGWSLSGISTIDRCTVGKPNVMDYIAPSNKSLGKQTMRPKLKYDDTDNLCIDGEQLVLISGTHLRNGAIYRTYKESYRLITYQEFYDTEAKVNAFRFEVRKPNGNIAIYGGYANARVQKEIEYLGARTPVFTWGLTTETDRSGNQISYRYKKWEAFAYQANKQRLFPTAINYPGGNINFGYVELNTYRPNAPQFGILEDDGVEAGPDRWRFNQDSGDQLTSITTEARIYRIIGSGQTRDELRDNGLKPSAIQECGSSTYMAYDQCLQPIKMDWLTRTTAYPEFPQSTSKYYEVAFLGGIIDSLGRKTEFQYDKIYGAYSTETRNKFSELPVTLPPTSGLSGVYDRTHGNKDKDNLNEIGFVVIQLRRGTGISSTPYVLNYQYRGAGTVSNLGKGFLGFPMVRVEDPAKGVVSYRIYELDKSTLGPVGIFGEISAVHNYTGIYGTGEKPLFKKEFRYSIKTLTHTSVAKTYLPVVDQTTELKYENGALLSAKIKSNNYELLSTVLSTVTSNIKTGAKLNPITHSPQYWGHNAPYTLDPSSVKHEQTTVTGFGSYTNFTDWRIGFVSDVTETSYNGAAGVSATDGKTKKVKYTQKLGTTLVEAETHFPGDAENEKTIAYTYNTKGQKETVTVSGKNIETRTSKMLDYVPNSTVPQKLVNAKGHETLVSDIDIRFNQPRKIINANGLVTSTTLDAFARTAQVIDENNVATTTYYKSCAIYYCQLVPGKLQSIQPVYYVETISPISPTIKEYYDSLGRVIRTEKQGFANETIYFDTQYDEFGRVYKTSMPYVAGATAYYETLAYDNKTDRITHRIRPDDTVIVTTYTTENVVANEPWLKVVRTDTFRPADGSSLLSQTKVSYLNSASQIVRVVDAFGTSQATTTSYEYDGLSNILRAVVDGGADGTTVSSAVYDNAGNKIYLTDPNAGTTTNRYNALGELREVTDAENNVTTYRYDVLGRLNYRTNKDGTYQWYYDSPGSAGTLSYTHDTQGFTKSYKYLNARLESITTGINIPGQPARSFKESFEYDTYGRLQKTTTPSGFAVNHRFNSYGYPSGLNSGDNSYSLWDISKQSALGVEEETLLGAKTVRGFDSESGRLEVLQSSQGINKYQDLRYHWYSNGSLDRRDNLLKNITDTFSYDNHDRLNITDTKDYNTGVSKRQLNQQYTNLGNLKSNTSNNPADTNVNSYLYGTTTNAGPHAVSNVTINGNSYQLYYNRNGAVTQYDGPGTANDKYIAYNVRNQPTNITLGLSLTDTNPTARDEFRYAEDGSLAYKKSTYQQSGVLRTEHTYYVGGYEVTFYDASSPLSKSEKTKIGRLLVTRNTPVSGSVVETLQALHLDYQGSVDAISGSNLLIQMAFEPFGVRRNTNLLGNITPTQIGDLLNSQTQYTADGYTGQRMLDRTGLIHMRGRVYDPVLGRFLSPDPVVQSPDNSQSWNRYSYVFNNPMKYIDPTGYEAESVEEVVVTGRRSGCDEVCQRKGYTNWYYSQIDEINRGNERWEKISEEAEPQPIIPVIPDEHQTQMEQLRQLAVEARDEVDKNCSWFCKLPWIRGSKVHKAFADKVRELNRMNPLYNAEISYIDGEVYRYGTPGSIRADAIYGLPSNPKFAVELKTGVTPMTRGEYNAYKDNLPQGVPVYGISVL